MIIPKERRKQIRDLADLFRKEYPEINVDSITEIAKKYGNVATVTKTPILGGADCVLYDEKDTGHIFYWATLPFCDEFNLAHEVGHSIIHSAIGGKRSFKEGLRYEVEADLFATQLCNIPRFLPYLYQHTLNGLADYGTDAINIFRRKKETERLKELGVYEVLKYHYLVEDSEHQPRSKKIGRRIGDFGYLIGTIGLGACIGGQANPKYGHYVGGALGALSFLGYKLKRNN